MRVRRCSDVDRRRRPHTASVTFKFSVSVSLKCTTVRVHRCSDVDRRRPCTASVTLFTFFAVSASHEWIVRVHRCGTSIAYHCRDLLRYRLWLPSSASCMSVVVATSVEYHFFSARVCSLLLFSPSGPCAFVVVLTSMVSRFSTNNIVHFLFLFSSGRFAPLGLYRRHPCATFVLRAVSVSRKFVLSHPRSGRFFSIFYHFFRSLLSWRFLPLPSSDWLLLDRSTGLESPSG